MQDHNIIAEQEHTTPYAYGKRDELVEYKMLQKSVIDV